MIRRPYGNITGKQCKLFIIRGFGAVCGIHAGWYYLIQRMCERHFTHGLIYSKNSLQIQTQRHTHSIHAIYVYAPAWPIVYDILNCIHTHTYIWYIECSSYWSTLQNRIDDSCKSSFALLIVQPFRFKVAWVPVLKKNLSFSFSRLLLFYSFARRGVGIAFIACNGVQSTICHHKLCILRFHHYSASIRQQSDSNCNALKWCEEMV